MNTYKEAFAQLLLVLISISLFGCAPAQVVVQQAPSLLQGQVEAIQSGTSLWVIEQAYSHTVNTFILQNKESLQTFFAAPIQTLGGWGTVVLDLAKREPILNWVFCSAGTGTLYGCSDMADLVTSALENGWDFVKPEELPPDMPKWIAVGTSWLQKVSSVNLPMLVVPMGMFDINMLPEPGEKR